MLIHGKDEEESPNITVGFQRIAKLYYLYYFAMNDSDYLLIHDIRESFV